MKDGCEMTGRRCTMSHVCVPISHRPEDGKHYIQGVPGGMSNTSGECSLCLTIPI
jgi:hypothetical protein